MMKFKFFSPYSPAGDQVQAIEKLTCGVKEGRGHQVLLGVTGSGKSLTYDEEILVFKQVQNALRPEILPIGKLVEKLINEYKNQTTNDTSVIPVNQTKERFAVWSINPKTGKQEVQPIKSFIRHDSPQKIFQVTTACGREIKVTGDHNFWVLRNGGFKLTKTSKIKENDYIPLPTKLNFGNILPEFKGIWLNEWLVRKAYFKLKDIPPECLKTHSEIKKILGHSKFRLASVNKERVDLKYLPLITRSLKNLNCLQIGYRSGKKIHLFQKISSEFLKLVGFYVAEGHADPRYLLISIHDKPLQKIFKAGLRVLKIDGHERNFNPGDFQINHSLWSEIFSNWCGNKAVNKSLPPWFLELNNHQLSSILSSYFSGDGNVTKNEVAAVTASRKLASDLSYALLRFGIKVRIRKKLKKATNSKMKKRLYFELVISGQNDLRTFAKEIGFVLERKQKKLEEIIKRKANTNVDLIPINGVDLRKLRLHLKLFQRDFGEMAKCERSYISMLEHNRRSPSKELLKKLIRAIKPNIQNKDNLKELKRLKTLTEIFWTKVKKIKVVKPVSKFVYDVAVKRNETFLAGMGGIFVHNTYTVANVIANTQKPTLVISHNKTLATQLYQEFKEFFPKNAVGFFISYYDYYQPEAYVPQTDTYIAKETDINEEIDKLRLKATSMLFSRQDVIIVASVSCIYNIGSPFEYGRYVIEIKKGQKINKEEFLYKLVALHYSRSKFELNRGNFRLRGDIIELLPAYADEILKIETAMGKVEHLTIRPLFTEGASEVGHYLIYPAKHYLTNPDILEEAFRQIQEDLKIRLEQLTGEGKTLEAHRLEQKVKYDLEMIKETGYVNGIENYSRHFDGRLPGEPPWTLVDYFRHLYKDNYLAVIDESHITVPQIQGMYRGDLSRKKILIDYGFRLPSCLDNRPLKAKEFWERVPQVVYMSATPDEWEIKKAKGKAVEQLVRPTGLVDPQVLVRPAQGQIQNLVKEIIKRKKQGQGVLVTTLTKKMAEELSFWFSDSKNTGVPISVHYLHADVATLERSDILTDLRIGKYDVVVGVNLLREGLDLPEVSLVAILDADKQGFLRSKTSLIQTMGRAARHVAGEVILYADRFSSAMLEAIAEVRRRRKVQLEYNRKYGIVPRSIEKPIRERIVKKNSKLSDIDLESLTPGEAKRLVPKLRRQMRQAAAALEFEKAAQLRDLIEKMLQ